MLSVTPRHFSLALLFLFSFMGSPALAQDHPLLVLQLEAEYGYHLNDRQAGMTGTIYALSRQQDDLPQQSIQIAYDARNRPVLLRLVQEIKQASHPQNMLETAQHVARLAVPDWQSSDDDLANALSEPLTRFLESGDAPASTIAIPGTSPAELRFVAAESLVALDFPVTAPNAEQLNEKSLFSIVSDATFILGANGTNPDALHKRYHSPDGRFGGVSSAGMPETGSWSLTADGQYCVEVAPYPETTCAYVYATGDNRNLLVRSSPPDSDSSTTTRPIPQSSMLPFTTQYGNPNGYAVPRRADATPAAVTRMIITGQTEERRRADGARERLFLGPDGQARGMRDGQPLIATWSVLQDGRRCLIYDADSFECAFLSETDGGTFRLFDAEQQHLGEVLYHDGNPDAY